MKKIETTNAPGAIGPYSQGYIANGFVFTSGQIPVDPVTGQIPEGISAQDEDTALRNGAVLPRFPLHVAVLPCILLDAQ